jgi:hypothetical protein
MKKIVMVIAALVLCTVLVLAAGCTQSAPPETQTTAPTATTAAATPTASPKSVSLTPGPTQTLPENWNIEIQVQSNNFAPDPKITATVRGGKGLKFIQRIDFRVTRSDGIVENGFILKELKVGDSVELSSTTAPGYADRAEVWATTPQGEKVKIFDAYVPFRTYN